MRILIVEDNEKHMSDAIRVAKEMGVEIATARNAAEAAKEMADGYWYDDGQLTALVDGVVSDIYMPLCDDDPWNHGSSPCGILVAHKAVKAGIPLVLCTAGYHHGSKYEWINQLARLLDWASIVDSSRDYHKEADTKPWKEALESVIGKIEHSKKLADRS